MKKLLLIEDDERLASLVCQYLQSNDFSVERLPNGDGLIALVKTPHPMWSYLM